MPNKKSKKDSTENRIKKAEDRIKRVEQAYRMFRLAMDKIIKDQQKIIDTAVRVMEQKKIEKLRKQIS